MRMIVITVLGMALSGFAYASEEAFQRLTEQYIDQFPALSPVSATTLGDHRFDGNLDRVSEDARRQKIDFYQAYLTRLRAIDVAQLTRPSQVDYALLQHRLEAELWTLQVLREWSWNPLVYTRLTGGAVYGLMSREFAPLEQRLLHVADRLEQFPRLFEQIRGSLDLPRVPRIHAETAIKQNRGVITILNNMVAPKLSQLKAKDATRLQQAIQIANAEVERHQVWLETELLPRAVGDFRLGPELYDKKLGYALHTNLSRQQIRERADSELKRVRAEMYEIAKEVYAEQYPYTRFPETPSRDYRQAIIRAALELAYQDRPAADDVLETAKESLEITTAFVKQKDLVTIPPDPVEIIVMPEFQRGVSFAYCDSPGPLDVGLKTFYAVSPIPTNWDDKQVESFLREYNVRSIHDLTVHEAMPGHFVQLALANQYPGKLRAVLASGTFIEGWAVYAEQMMADEGLLDHDPLMTLIARKWYLRGIANAILDQAIHTDGIDRDTAMRLMMEDTFQEEREAAAKWVRAQLTGAQLSTYFVGYLEHADLRQETELNWGDEFQLKAYHDRVLSHGSPPVKFVRALILEKPIPR
ncbi:MAG: DUF885 domain-containing protein [Planctomycetaceae bacterium]|nr:DUF885 domain-containing protein [Planctomycetaceae bacterium]